MTEAVKLHMCCLSSNNDRHPVPNTFTPLHHTLTHSVTSLHVLDSIYFKFFLVSISLLFII